MQILKKAYVLLSGILFFLMMLPFVKGLMLLYAFGGLCRIKEHTLTSMVIAM